MPLLRLHLPLLCIVATINGCGSDDRASYARDIEPILHFKCRHCHTSDSSGFAAGGFSVDDYTSVMQGGNHGPVLNLADPESSKLPKIILGEIEFYENDSDHYAPTNQAQRDKLAAWVRQGVLSD